MAGRRLLVFIVLLLLVAAVASAIAPSERELEPRRTTTEPPVAAAPATAARVVEGTLPQDRRVRARVGDIVQIEVMHTAPDEVQIAALGVTEPVEPGLAAELVFDADREGRFAVTLRDSAKRLGTVEIRPAG